ncbi:MAG: CarD family transcriptional regulator [Smithellaceae bacterium]|nr:CarD family transcriptional regulator [Smithellaceae bacterium]
MFKVGDLAVYPAQGVGVIESIENREVMGKDQRFYVLKIRANGMRIMIPTDSAQAVGLRQVIHEKEVPKVYEILRNKKVPVDRQSWNRRSRDYTERMKTGSVYEVAKILRDLSLLKVDKNLSFCERKMMDTAKSLLIREISASTKSDEMEIEQDLKKMFSVGRIN